MHTHVHAHTDMHTHIPVIALVHARDQLGIEQHARVVDVFLSVFECALLHRHHRTIEAPRKEMKKKEEKEEKCLNTW